MKFTVVIAAYNAAGTISAALKSCMEQTFPAFEIIVVDDASIDNTSDILEQYSPTIKTIRHENNKGVSAARNAGWEAASGDYVAFLDSDDIWHKDKLKLLNSFLFLHPHSDFIGHSFSTDATNLQQSFSASNFRKVSFGSLLLRNYFQGSSIIVKRNLTIRFDTHLRYSEDYDLALRHTYAGKCFFIDAPFTLLSRPQRSIGGLSGNTAMMRKGEMYSYSKLWRLNILFLPLVPVLWLLSLIKHTAKLLK